MTVRKRFTENPTNVLNKNIELFSTSHAPDLRCNVLVTPQWLPWSTKKFKARSV